jgi:hypothetical protein
LETDSLTVELTPLFNHFSNPTQEPCSQDPSQRTLRMTPAGSRFAHARKAASFHFFVRRVLAATAAEFLEFQPLRGRFTVFRGRIIPLFAVTAL